MTNAKKIAVNFERSLEDLEALVTQMESGDLSLEEALQAFEKGVKLTRECQQALREAEQKVEVLLSDHKDELTFEPFEVDEDSTDL